MSRRILNLISIVPLAVLSYAAGPPQIEISNEAIRAKLYLPDSAEGFYRSTRFDWSGVIYSLVYQGHDYYGPWFSEFDPTVRDFTHRDGKIVVGAVSAMTGPVEEFQKPLGSESAPAGARSSKSVLEFCASRTMRTTSPSSRMRSWTPANGRST